MKPETREKMRQAKLRAWAAMSPEERAARISRNRRNQQLYAIKHKNLRRPDQVSTCAIDPDFDEAL